MLHRVYNWLVLIIVTYAIVAFNIGFVPFENNLLKKEFLPGNAALKYTTVSAMLLLMLLFWLAGLRVALTPQQDPRVLLTKM